MRDAPTLTVLLMLLAEPAFAQDGPECFSTYTKYNICEKARELQARMASALPMKISANVTLLNVVVFGPRLAVTGVWNMTKADVQDSLWQSGSTMQQLEQRVQQMTSNHVCSSRNLQAFVGLKGELQYFYKTSDGFQLFSPVVTSCPERP